MSLTRGRPHLQRKRCTAEQTVSARNERGTGARVADWAHRRHDCLTPRQIPKREGLAVNRRGTRRNP